jgi:hypothetical protein
MGQTEKKFLFFLNVTPLSTRVYEKCPSDFLPFWIKKIF